MREKKIIGRIIYHVLVCAFGFIMVYPLLWMIMSSFKVTNTIFSTASSLIPTQAQFTFDNYVNGWKGFAGIKFITFFKNSFLISTIATIGATFSSAVVAYGFARSKFRGRGFLFAGMLVSMMLPFQVIMIPQFIWFRQLGWIGSYLPLIMPYFFGQGFFIFMIMGFIQGIPTELDEAAKIDGCSYYGIFGRIMLPMIVPAMVTSAIFSFMWRWDDYLSALLYLQNPLKYPVSRALQLFSDPGTSSDFGAMFAMASLSILPAVLIFIFFQKYLVDGIANTGLKG
jgi:ABC-type sugar transport system, permease component